MENLVITGNSNVYLVPQINFDASSGYCEIVGESYLEESKEFYDNIMNWLRTYMQEVRGSLKVDIKLSYFNTSSSRCLLEVFRMLKSYELEGNLVEVNWYLEAGEDYTVEEVEDFVINSGLVINPKIMDNL